MPAVKTADAGASFLFVGDLNGHYQEWLGSTTLGGMVPWELPILGIVVCGYHFTRIYFRLATI